MALVAMWKCDRDGTMFDDKRQALEHDKMLELAANITAVIEENIPGVDEAHSESIGLLLARNKEELIRACKGTPEALLEISQQSNVSPIAAKQ